jgi:hypothetical protein
MFHKWTLWKISYWHNVKHRKLQLIKVKESVSIICFGMYGHKKNTKNCVFLKTAHVWELFLYKYLCYYRLMTDNFTHNVSNTKSKGTHATVCIFLETGLLYLWTYPTQCLNKGTTNGKHLHWQSTQYRCFIPVKVMTCTYNRREVISGQ